MLIVTVVTVILYTVVNDYEKQSDVLFGFPAGSVPVLLSSSPRVPRIVRPLCKLKQHGCLLRTMQGSKSASRTAVLNITTSRGLHMYSGRGDP